jgi:hypothetical protein
LSRAVISSCYSLFFLVADVVAVQVKELEERRFIVFGEVDG